MGRHAPRGGQALGGAWREHVPFLDHDVEIHKIIWTTDAIERLNAFAITFDGRINPSNL